MREAGRVMKTLRSHSLKVLILLLAVVTLNSKGVAQQTTATLFGDGTDLSTAKLASNQKFKI
jgi:hypothetical protein